MGTVPIHKISSMTICNFFYSVTRGGESVSQSVSQPASQSVSQAASDMTISNSARRSPDAHARMPLSLPLEVSVCLTPQPPFSLTRIPIRFPAIPTSGHSAPQAAFVVTLWVSRSRSLVYSTYVLLSFTRIHRQSTTHRTTR